MDNNIKSWIMSSEHESCSIDINWEMWIRLIWMMLSERDSCSVRVRRDSRAWLDDELDEHVCMRIILEYDWAISMWEEYEHARIALSYDDISIM